MKDLISPQPDPIRNEHPASWDLVVQDLESFVSDNMAKAVIRDMRSRDQFGLNKYGMRIQPHNGRDNLVDAYQEVLDSAVYFRTSLYEKETPILRSIYQEVLSIILRLREAIDQRDGT